MILRQPDWCSPWGIRRPAALPPDDAVTDAQAALAAAVEHAYLDLKIVSGAAACIPDTPGGPAANPTPAAGPPLDDDELDEDAPGRFVTAPSPDVPQPPVELPKHDAEEAA